MRLPIFPLLATLLCACLSSTSAYAWNATGHRLIASLAWTKLSPQARLLSTKWLREHPDYTHWRERSALKNELEQATDFAGSAKNRAIFIEASTWPDEIRHDKRFYTPGLEAQTPLLPGFPNMEKHRDWHYQNLPIDDDKLVKPRLPSGALGVQVAELSKTLWIATQTALKTPAKRRAEQQRASYALPWLIHLIGDMHQPLHTSTRLTKTGQWDRGGNDFLIINPFSNSRKNVVNLHQYWDSLPGHSRLRGLALSTAANELDKNYPSPKSTALTADDRSAAWHTFYLPWFEQSWQIACDAAYPDDDADIPMISGDFHENAQKIANQQIVNAAYRLADLLNQIVAET